MVDSERFPEAQRCATEGHTPGSDWGCSSNGVADVWCARCDAMYQVPFEQLPNNAQSIAIDIFVPKQ
jgi:hypothetical protein